MRSEELDSLRNDLRRAGVSRRYIARTLEELQDHFADLEADELAAGCAPAEAARRARELLGTGSAIAAAVRSRPELRGWTARWPRTAGCVRSVCALAAYPVAPVGYLAGHGPDVARWSVSTGLSLLLTSALLLTLSSALQL